MHKIVKQLLFLLFLTSTAVPATPVDYRLTPETVIILDELSKMYRASMGYIFKNQPLINQKNADKSALFGNRFIENVKRRYQSAFDQPFPKQDHLLKKMLVQAMIEVMDDNRTLLNDSDISFKGFIPAIFAFQLSEKLSSKGLGVKIKFTNVKNMIRNKLNTPDKWESYAIAVVRKLKLNSYFDNKSSFDDKPAYRYFVPVKMKPFCLHCHGMPKDNPLNRNKEESQWTHIDKTGFAMENWQLDDFAGGVSVTIYKRDL